MLVNAYGVSRRSLDNPKSPEVIRGKVLGTIKNRVALIAATGLTNLNIGLSFMKEVFIHKMFVTIFASIRYRLLSILR